MYQKASVYERSETFFFATTLLKEIKYFLLIKYIELILYMNKQEQNMKRIFFAIITFLTLSFSTEDNATTLQYQESFPITTLNKNGNDRPSYPHYAPPSSYTDIKGEYDVLTKCLSLNFYTDIDDATIIIYKDGTEIFSYFIRIKNGLQLSYNLSVYNIGKYHVDITNNKGIHKYGDFEIKNNQQ